MVHQYFLEFLCRLTRVVLDKDSHKHVGSSNQTKSDHVVVVRFGSILEEPALSIAPSLFICPVSPNMVAHNQCDKYQKHTRSNRGIECIY